MSKTKKSQIGKKVGLGFLETVIHVGVYVLIIFLFIRAATLAFDFSYHVFGDPVSSQYNTEEVNFQVVEGSTMQQVAQNLEKQDFIKYNLAFRIRAKLENLEEKLVPGTYKLSQSMTEDQILAIITTPTTNTGDAVLGEDASGTITDETTAADPEQDQGDVSEGE